VSAVCWSLKHNSEGVAHSSMASSMTRCCASAWRRTNLSTTVMLQSGRALRGRPLPGRRSVIPVALSPSVHLLCNLSWESPGQSFILSLLSYTFLIRIRSSVLKSSRLEQSATKKTHPNWFSASVCDNITKE